MAEMDYSRNSPFSYREATWLNTRLGMAPSNSRKLRKALANVRTGTADAKILCVGDSTTAGVGISGNIHGLPNSYPYQLAAMLNSFVPSAAGLGIPGPNAGSDDPRFTKGTGWNYRAGFSWGNASNLEWTGGVVGNLVYADPNVLADRFDVYYMTSGGLGTVGITATGGATVNQATSGASGIGKVTVSAGSALTSNTVTFVPANNGSLYIIGVEPWLSTTKKVRVGNAGVGSSRLTGHWDVNGTQASTAAIKAYAPDLTIISLGINDAAVNTPASSIITSLDFIADAAAISGDVWVMSLVPSRSDTSASRLSFESQYTEAVKNHKWPYVDLNSRWKDGDDANSLGFMSDALHPSALGYSDIAYMLKSLVLNA